MQRYRGLEVRKVEIEGIDGGLAGELKKGLELSGVKNLIGADRARFYSQILRQDLERARLFLAREGYPRAVLDASVAPHGEDQVDVSIQVQPGPPVRVARVDLFGFPRDRRQSIKERITVERGQRFRDADVDASVAAAKLDLQNAGYARSEVEGRIELLDSLRVVVTIDAESGPLCRYRDIQVEGTKPDLVKLVRRSVGIDRGTLYSVSDLERARDRLRLLGLFRQVRLELLDAPGFDRDAETAEVDLVLHLSDRPPRSLEAGVGYWSEDGVRLQGRWQHRNLLQGGRGFELSSLFSEPRREIDSSLWWPALFRADVRGELGGHIAWQYEEAFDARRRGGDLSFVYRPNLRSTIRTGLEIERVTITRADPEPDEARITRETQIRLAAAWSFDTTDDRLDPTRGQLVSLQATKVIPTGLTKNDFVVYDAKSSDDITRSVLTQIIFEQESKGQNLLPITFLRQLIRFYGDSIQNLIPTYLDFSIDSLVREQEKFRNQMTSAFGPAAFGTAGLSDQVRRNTEMFEQAMRMFLPFGGGRPAQTSAPSAPETPAEKSDLDQLKKQLDEMQKRLDRMADKS